MKKLDLVLLVSMAMGLTACGGGGSGGSSNSNSGSNSSSSTTSGSASGSTSTTAPALSDFYTYSFAHQSTTANTLLDYSDHIHVVNNAYYDQQNTAVAQALDWTSSTIPSSYYLTQTALYTPDTTLYADGYKLENIVALSDSSTTSIPANTGGYNDLQVTRSVQWYDLSGQPVTTHTNVYLTEDMTDPVTAANYPTTATTTVNATQAANNAAMLKFINLAQTTNYPQGAGCFIIQQGTSVNPFIEFEINSYASTQTLDQIAAQDKASGYSVISGTWAGYNWLSSTKADPAGISNSLATISFNNKTYFGGYNPVTSHANDVTEAQYYYNQAVSTGDAKQIHFAQHNLDDMQQTCDGYNKVAADTINQLINAATH